MTTAGRSVIPPYIQLIIVILNYMNKLELKP